MKYALAAVALAAVARAQTIEDIPDCARSCILDSAASVTDCGPEDVACLCENFSAVQADAITCVTTECGAEVAIGEVLPATQALCANAGEGDDEPAETTTEAEETTTSEAPSSTETVITTTEATVITTTVESTMTTTPSMTPTMNGTAPPETTVPAPGSGAGKFSSVGAFAMLVLGAIAL